MDVLMIISIALLLFSVWARLTSARRIRTISQIDDDITRLYEHMRSYGDPIHISLGIYAAKLFYLATTSTMAIALTLSALYMVYQIVERDNSAPKDIAVYTASLAVAYSYYSGIPIPMHILSS
jgi:hypothetical protein